MSNNNIQTQEKEQETASYWDLYRFCDRKHKVYLALGTLAAWFSGAGIPIFLLFLSDLTDSFTPGTDPKVLYDKAVKVGLIFVYIGIGLWVVSYFYMAFFGVISEHVGYQFRIKYLESILKQDMSWFELNDPQSLAAQMNKDIAAIQQASGDKVGNLILILALTISSFCTSISIGWEFSLVCLGLFSFASVSTIIMLKTIQIGYKKSEQAFKASSIRAEQALTSIKIVAAYGQEQKEEDRFIEYLDTARKTSIKAGFISSLGYSLVNSTDIFMYAVGIYLSGLFVFKGVNNSFHDKEYTTGDTLSIFLGVFWAMFALGIAGPNIKAITKGRQAAKSVLDTINREPHILLDDPTAEPVGILSGDIQLSNVSFQYQSRKTKALDNVNITFEKGKVTALVGPSGSGKSTIVQLIERFYDPDAGQVLIDGRNLKSLHLRDFRLKVGYVDQEPILFNQTIRENLLYGNPDATEEQMMKALTNANASKIIARLPEGLETVVGAQGQQLSGGEKQRIALARVFVKDPKVLILDEATSALDNKNEAEVQIAIDRLKKGCYNITTIVIAHRLTTIKDADKIVVLKDGQVVQEGTHRQLLIQHPEGIYAEMFEAQEEVDDEENQQKSINLSQMLSDFMNDKENSEGDENTDKESSKVSSQHEVSENSVENDSEFYQKSIESSRKESDSSISNNTDIEIEEIKVDMQKERKLVSLSYQLKALSQPKMSQNLQKPLSKITTFKRQTEFKNIAECKKQKADEMDEIKKDELNKVLEGVKKKGYFRRLIQYNRPYVFIAIGLFWSILIGCVYPIFGVIYTKALFSILINDQEKVNNYALFMAIIGIVSFIATYSQKVSFSILSENMTKEIRKSLYHVLLRKHISWFDRKENNIGTLISLLSSEVYALNGASTEGISILIETFTGLVAGIITSFVFAWKFTLIIFAILPFIIFGTFIQAKFTSGFSNKQEMALKEVNLLISDAINNHKAVSSFANENLVIETVKNSLQPIVNGSKCRANLNGLAFGYGIFMRNITYAVSIITAAAFIRFDGASALDIFSAWFVIIFSAFGAGQAQQYAPSIGKAYRSAQRIFMAIDEPSEVNIDEDTLDQALATNDTFNGTIEFKNIWFRYPTRPEVWILKDFTLAIEPKEHIALVGESGIGKSTIFQLLYRFYEPHFGQILINGIDIKKYNVTSLRRQLGLVQQMPTLFNESVLYNICYGEVDEDSTKAMRSAEIANATPFISKLGQQDHTNSNLVIEEREETKEEDTEAIRKGLNANCGNSGSKLSGGQKQRVAIARAVHREPQMLLLDEATSALDEVSQGKVQAALEQVMKGRTSVVIAHRLTTIENVDRVIILRDGSVFREGIFNDLKSQL